MYSFLSFITEQKYIFKTLETFFVLKVYASLTYIPKCWVKTTGTRKVSIKIIGECRIFISERLIFIDGKEQLQQKVNLQEKLF